MDIPEILQGEVHVPLREHMTGEEAIALANTFYQTDLRPEMFQEAQAIVSNGQVILDLLDPSSGEVLVSFVNKRATTAPKEKLSLFNPMVQATETHKWLAAPLRLVDAAEMAFLDELGEGGIAMVGGVSDAPYKLSQLLNSYNLLGGWTSGTIGHRCTGGFQLVYKGWSIEAPEGFVTEYASELAIIKINHGSEQGYLCLMS